ncbi:MAG: hypothetical protein ACXWZI_03335, partial [Mycobacterium sp.]
MHDGPQQRLVRLAMDLGRAQQQLDRDPEATGHSGRGGRPDTGDARRATRTLPRDRATGARRSRRAQRVGRTRRPVHRVARPRSGWS